MLPTGEAHLVKSVESKLDHPFKAGRGNAGNHRARQMLSQLHTEHRRRLGIFLCKRRHADARAGRRCGKEQPAAFSVPSAQQNDLVVRRLINLFYFCANRRLRKLVADRFCHSRVISHKISSFLPVSRLFSIT